MKQVMFFKGVKLNSVWWDRAAFVVIVLACFIPMPATEGWFLELTRNMSLGQILVNDEILLPPIYPILIWLIGCLNDSVLLYRLLGVVVGFLLYRSTAQCLALFLSALNLTILRTEMWPCKAAALLTLLYAIASSTYLLLYDFAVIVLLVQVEVMRNIFICIFGSKKLPISFRKPLKNNFSTLACSFALITYRKRWIYIAFLLSVGLGLKHSNMLVFAVGLILICILTCSFDKQIFGGLVAVVSGMIIFFLVEALIYVLAGGNSLTFLSFLGASVGAKGGGQSIYLFLSSFVVTLISIGLSIQSWTMGLLLIAPSALSVLRKSSDLICVSQGNIKEFTYDGFIRWIAALDIALLTGILVFSEKDLVYLILAGSLGLLLWSSIGILFVKAYKFINGKRIPLAGSQELISIKPFYAALVGFSFGLVVALANVTSAGLGYNGVYICFALFLSIFFAFAELGCAISLKSRPEMISGNDN